MDRVKIVDIITEALKNEGIKISPVILYKPEGFNPIIGILGDDGLENTIEIKTTLKK